MSELNEATYPYGEPHECERCSLQDRLDQLSLSRLVEVAKKTLGVYQLDQLLIEALMREDREVVRGLLHADE